MSYCLNPNCPCPTSNSVSVKFCTGCGFKLLLAERYRAIKQIGQGGFGRTFLAVDEYKPSQPRCVQKFGDRVGWRKGWRMVLNKEWIGYDEVIFDTSAPFGHLPVKILETPDEGKGRGRYNAYPIPGTEQSSKTIAPN